MKTKLIETSSVLYQKRLAKEINRAGINSAPTYKLAGSQYDGTRIRSAFMNNGVLFGNSLNGDNFPINVNCVFDAYNGEQICASREP
jgi:hypothetical protein